MATPDYATNTNFILKNGNVKVLKESGIIKTWKTRYMILCVSSSLGWSCIIKYKDRGEFETNRGKDIYYLAEINQVQQDIKDKSCIDIRMNDSTTLTLKFEKVGESTSWFQTIKDTKQLDASKCPPFAYISYVKVIENNDRVRFLGECCLIIDRDSVKLNLHNGTPIANWPYKVIRNFTPSTNDITFSVEVGRAAETGEGLFMFASSQTKDIINHLVSSIILPAGPGGSMAKSTKSSKSSTVPPGKYLTAVHLEYQK